MRLPIRPLTRPSSLNGQMNGRLTPTLLHAVPALSGGVDARLLEPTARGWAAFQQAAFDAGFGLVVQYQTNAYRPYADQARIFRERYIPHSTWLPGRKRWEGKWWSKRSGVAAAAVPGTSNHGWGLAVDVSERVDGRLVSLTQPALKWMTAHAHLYGFSWELTSEPWHIRWYVGDHIPQAVLNYEAAHSYVLEGDEMKQVNDTNKGRLFTVYLVNGTTTVREHSTYIPEAGEKMPNVSYIIDEQIDKGEIKKAA